MANLSESSGMERVPIKKILIAEDDSTFKERYKSWAESLGYLVLEATSIDEGLELLCQADALITDHGLKPGNGNDLAKIAKQYDLPVAGISGSGPDVFYRNVVDIAESKTINEGNFKRLLSCLFEKNPSEAYARTKKDVNFELPAAASILLQGYYFCRAVKEGALEIVADGNVIVSREQFSGLKEFLPHISEKDPKEMFDMFAKGEISATQVYSDACELNPKLQTDTRLKGIFDRIEAKDYDLTIDDAVYASKKILDGCM